MSDNDNSKAVEGDIATSSDSLAVNNDPDNWSDFSKVMNHSPRATQPLNQWHNDSIYSDRYIPQRTPVRWRRMFLLGQCRSDVISNQNSMVATPPSGAERSNHTSYLANSRNERARNAANREEVLPGSSRAFARLVRSELVDFEMEQWNQENIMEAPHSNINSNSGAKRGLFIYKPDRGAGNLRSMYSPSPLSTRSTDMLRQPKTPTRKIAKVPYKVLDAPNLQDDFYLNLIDWSNQNVLAVGLATEVYLWSASTSQVTRLCSCDENRSTNSEQRDTITSVSWTDGGTLLAIGTNKGRVEIWDTHKERKISTMLEHNSRVGAMSWNGDLLATGSRDRQIIITDVRTRPSNISSTLEPIKRLQHHRQEVCGLRWSPDRTFLASGGNDNKLLVWSPMQSQTPAQIYSEHAAAVKAIAWSPHHHGLLASGGGTADRCIRFWNTLTQTPLQYVDTGSQVCNLAWSKYASELVSTHGYSQNQILVWKYPSLTQITKLTGHTYRVLYLAVSPDGESVVTGAGDETLRFWNIFNKSSNLKDFRSKLDIFTALR